MGRVGGQIVSAESPAERLNQCEMRSETAKPNRQGVQDNDDYFLSFRFSRFSVRRVYVYVCAMCTWVCVCAFVILHSFRNDAYAAGSAVIRSFRRGCG